MNLKDLKPSKLKALLYQPVVRNILIVSIITLVIKGVGFYKETVIAANFGLSEMLDTFFIAYLVPGFIHNVFLGAFKSVFIPNYVTEMEEGNQVGAFQASGYLITAGVTSLFMLVAYLFTDVYLEVFFAGHTEAYYELIKVQFYWLLPSIMFWGFSSLLSGLLNIADEFKYTAWESIFIPICMIGALFLFREELGETVLAVGTFAGSLLAFLYLLGIGLWKKVIYVARPNFQAANTVTMFKQLPAKVSSGFLTGMNGIVDQYFAAQLAVGSIAAINYGMKMPAFFRGILVIAITNVLLPYFSKKILRDRERTFKNLMNMMRNVFLLCSVIAVAGILLTEFFVELFFERKEFTSEDTAIVTRIQQIILVYIPFSIAGMINVNFLTSINKNSFMAWVSLIALVLNVILDYILMQYFDVFGIAMCTTIVMITKNLILFSYTVHLYRYEIHGSGAS